MSSAWVDLWGSTLLNDAEGRQTTTKSLQSLKKKLVEAPVQCKEALCTLPSTYNG